MPPAISPALFAPIASAVRETLVAAYCDGGGRLVGMRHIAGLSGSVAPSIRALAIDALAFGARVAVIAHNHPSGDTRPSAHDLAFTRRLVAALAALEVTLHDHLILAGGQATSLRDLGYL